PAPHISNFGLVNSRKRAAFSAELGISRRAKQVRMRSSWPELAGNQSQLWADSTVIETTHGEPDHRLGVDLPNEIPPLVSPAECVRARPDPHALPAPAPARKTRPRSDPRCVDAK